MAKVSRKRKKDPTIEPQGGTAFAGVPQTIGTDAERDDIVKVLQGYKSEATDARRGGLNPRDDKWSQNLNLYWNRYDFSKKAQWQAREVMPEVPAFVDRFAAALKEALVATPNGFYTVTDPADKEGDLAAAIKRMTDIWLTTAGRNQVGQLLHFSSVFEEQMKMGALMACSSVTTWKNDVPGGRVAVETVDPRFVWLDHTYRNLYRIRRTELDVHELHHMALAKDSAGNPIFNLPDIAMLVSGLSSEDTRFKEETSGHGSQIMSTRKPVVLDEYVATVVGNDGKILADRALMVVANEKHLIRGPEKNPFWHGKDWLTFAPLVTAPLSVYGRSYMEDFGSVAKTFTELTNMILDAVHTSSLNAYAMVPGMLLNPEQVTEGISPNKLFLLEDGFKAGDFAEQLELGKLSPDSLRIWQAIKGELTEAAGLNEIGIGQFAPKGRTSATEVIETQQSSSALIRSVSQTIETRWLDPNLDLIWKTGLQHLSPNDSKMREAVGDPLFSTIMGRKREFITKNYTFQARGISQLIARNQQLKALMTLLSIIAQSEVLMAQFLKEVDIGKLVKRLFELSNIDITSLQVGEREKMVRMLTEGLTQAQAGAGTPPEGGPPGVQGLPTAMGLGR